MEIVWSQFLNRIEKINNNSCKTMLIGQETFGEHHLRFVTMVCAFTLSPTDTPTAPPTAAPTEVPSRSPTDQAVELEYTRLLSF